VATLYPGQTATVLQIPPSRRTVRKKRRTRKSPNLQMAKVLASAAFCKNLVPSIVSSVSARVSIQRRQQAGRYVAIRTSELSRSWSH
jgi:hypothetical protein